MKNGKNKDNSIKLNEYLKLSLSELRIKKEYMINKIIKNNEENITITSNLFLIDWAMSKSRM